MRLHRFYINKPLGEEIVVENVGGEKELIHQWTRVFRYTSGDEVFLFSPLSPGKDFLYQLSSFSQQAITLTCISSLPNIIPTSRITLVMALVKKDTFETIVRQATELGVSRIIPVRASRSEKKNLNLERLVSISKEATEQSGRGGIPEITPILSFEEALKTRAAGVNILGSLHGKHPKALIPQGNHAGNDVALWVGPEGGWTEDEEKIAAESGFFLLKLTETVLKADTAAITLISSFIALSSTASLD